MEIQTISPRTSTDRFIKSNTQVVTLSELEDKHIIPVFAKDNELTISHSEFVKQVFDAVWYVYGGDEHILPVSVRVSHPIQGRVPEARDKQPHELLEHEKTLYYERMMFAIEVPSVITSINGQSLNLVVGGVKSYHKDKLSGKRTEQTFKVYVGFKVQVCSNFCVASDGCVVEFKSKNVDEIFLQTVDMLEGFDHTQMLNRMQAMQDQYLSRQEFEHLIGRIRVQYLDPDKDTTKWLGDQQMGQVAKGYFESTEFGRRSDGSISLWNIYNLFTEANKSSYIDTFLERSAWSFELFA
jgi:hypothetical protein